ncbi:DMT family transporter [Sneathiella sp.]|jgi:drug/metabolite transporter (DMT)-like permease|uniref:DMT family transporter n=1 Tax=Sneathiella sp. TaxID=1964365 RepID=UPI0039E59C41
MSNSSAISQNTSINLFNWFILIILSFLWGGSFFFNGVAVKELPVLTVVLGRVSLAAFALFFYLRIRGHHFPTDLPTLKAFAVIGLVNNLIPFSLIVFGQTHISSGLASILNATTPLFAALVAHLIGNEASEKLTIRRTVGILLGIAGVAIMLGPDIGTYGLSSMAVLGQFAVLGATFLYGFGVVYVRRLSQQGIEPAVSATGQVAATTVILLPIVLIVDQPWTFIASVSDTVLLAIGGLAFFSTAVAYILYFHLIKTAGSTNASLVTLLIPVSAIIMGYLFLGESISLIALAGMGCIAMGLLVIDGRLLNYFR